MIMTESGTMIRTPVNTISQYSRTARGVIIMRLSGDTKIRTFACLPHEDEVEEIAESVQENANETVQTSDAVEVTETTKTTEETAQ